jgi:hypothetical protein
VRIPQINYVDPDFPNHFTKLRRKLNPENEEKTKDLNKRNFLFDFLNFSVERIFSQGFPFILFDLFKMVFLFEFP